MKILGEAVGDSLRETQRGREQGGSERDRESQILDLLLLLFSAGGMRGEGG